ncbi:hypothetical protein HPB52_023399 [Rhipicephalus sanguineus]|uniref:Endonuclease/exonuclease/phosphatase domain-containing protein n=1 Tax=Rhipicephalus sanguineus TaxID=34632 RepID=A0A9D4PCP2_RHISA|nr:hypothetical protein HPB52_023399 [Rhipicephalus sanguineus]
MAQFDRFSNPRQVTRKKANSHDASRSVSPTRRRNIESVEDGNPYPSLQELIKPNQPDIIALQETNTQYVRLQGYMTCAQTQRTAILAKKALSAQKHELEQTQIEHTLIEILPERKMQQSLFMANLYSPPRDQLPDFDHFVREIRKRTNGHQVVIVGDLNASHTAWGYHITTKKGSREKRNARQLASHIHSSCVLPEFA